MRILHTGDWHLGKYLEGMSRLDEQEAFLEDFVALVEEQRIQLILIAGDVYDSFTPPARAEQLFYKTLERLCCGGERIVVVIAGNHDSPDRLVAAGPLAQSHGILMFGTPKTQLPLGQYGQHRITASWPGCALLEMQTPRGLERITIGTVAFPSEKRLNEVIYSGLDEDNEKLASYEERMQLLFDQIDSRFSPDTINLLVAHLFVMGSQESGSERSIQLGGSYLIGSSIFPSQAQYIALGHVHKPQLVPGSHGKAVYSGSPLHYNRSEINYEKSVVVVDVEVGKGASLERIPLKVYKPIEVWQCESIEAALERCEKNKDHKAYVYLEIMTDTYIKEDQIKAMKGFKADIIGIKPISTRLWAQEKDAPSRGLHEQSFSELFKAFYLKERGLPVSDETFSTLMTLIESNEADDSFQQEVLENEAH